MGASGRIRYLHFGGLWITNDPFSPMIGKGMGLDSGITRPCL